MVRSQEATELMVPLHSTTWTGGFESQFLLGSWHSVAERQRAGPRGLKLLAVPSYDFLIEVLKRLGSSGSR